MKPRKDCRCGRIQKSPERVRALEYGGAVYRRFRTHIPNACVTLRATAEDFGRLSISHRARRSTRGGESESLQPVPHTASATVLLQMVALGQVAEVLLQGVAAGSGQFDGVHHRDAPMLSGEFHDLK